MNRIFKKLEQGGDLTYLDAVSLLDMELFSEGYYLALALANRYAHETFRNKGVVFGQIGLDATPCSVDCNFCRLGASNFDGEQIRSLPLSHILRRVKDFVDAGADEIFLMCTAEYGEMAFLEVAKAVKATLPPHVRMIANTADFNLSYAKALKEVGFYGVYHICRLGEGVDTKATLSQRINTLHALKAADLALYYCVEPIGPEHTSEEIATEIFRAIEFGVDVMAVMRRVCFEGSPKEAFGEITSAQLALICAVTTLATKPKRAMGVHEPDLLCLIAGANQIYAECGSNPRDTNSQTELGRGFGVKEAREMLGQAHWTHQSITILNVCNLLLEATP